MKEFITKHWKTILIIAIVLLIIWYFFLRKKKMAPISIANQKSTSPAITNPSMPDSATITPASTENNFRREKEEYPGDHGGLNINK